MDMMTSGPPITETNNAMPIKLYKRRWCMLALFMLYSVTSNMQAFEYSSISNIICKYYNVSRLAVDCTSMVFWISCVIFTIPVLILKEKMNLRTTIILGSICNCLGAWIKMCCLSTDKFYVLLIGQFIAAFTQPLGLPLPGRIAAKWFGMGEQSTATALGVFGMQLGQILSFLVPTTVVRNHDSLADIETDIKLLELIVVISATINFLLVIVLFQDEPKLPPSKTRALQKTQCPTDGSILLPITRLFADKQFLLLCNAFGFTSGVANAFTVMLNELYMIHFKDGEIDVGRLGFLYEATSAAGSLFTGIVLDKTHEFKTSIVTLGALCFGVQMFLSTSFIYAINPTIFIFTGVAGFSATAYLTSGYESGIEFTYPADEILSAGILQIFNCLFSITFVLILSGKMDIYGEITVHVIICVMFFLGLIMTMWTKDVQKRQNASKTNARVEE